MLNMEMYMYIHVNVYVYIYVYNTNIYIYVHIWKTGNRKAMQPRRRFNDERETRSKSMRRMRRMPGLPVTRQAHGDCMANDLPYHRLALRGLELRADFRHASGKLFRTSHNGCCAIELGPTPQKSSWGGVG